MADEDTNLPTGESVNVEQTQFDNPDGGDIADSYEEQTVDGGEEGIEGEAAEGDELNAAQSEQAENEATDPADSDTEQPEDGAASAEPATFKLADGTEVTQDELIAGNMREADYRRKTQAVAEANRSVQAQAQRLEAQVEALAGFISQQLPPEPDMTLAYSDPATFNAQKAIYDQQMQQVTQLLSMADEPKNVARELTASEHQNLVQEENSRLTMAYPQTGTEQGRKEFFDKAFEGGKHFGFPQEEMNAVTDHRMIAMARYAAIGMASEKAKATAKRKVAAAPQAKPSKQRTPPKVPDTMRRLGETGSHEDAVRAAIAAGL